MNELFFNVLGIRPFEHVYLLVTSARQVRYMRQTITRGPTDRYELHRRKG